MAIVQISQISNRLGLNIDLPQLAGAELGWSTDTRQLYIGNGTLEEGAPVIGNTEILTEFSDILNLAAAYTYKGTAAGYTVQTGPTPGSPVVLSLQSWLDQFATVKDFGATGNGLTDDTAAINRALNQLYCQQSNPQIRRSLFFPAGVYRISGPINIPPYATLYGEGPDNSIIQMVASSGSGSYVAQTADSLQQTGINIGTNGATPPTDINIINMAFQSLDNSKNIFLVQSATNCEFRGVSFIGAGTTSTLTVDTLGTSGVNFGSFGISLITTNILFDSCRFGGTVYGINTSQQTKGVAVNNSSFNILYQGIALGTGSIVNGGPTGTRITNNVFDNIFSHGIILGAINLNATGYNIFYDVGDSFAGITSPTASIIVFEGNNVSIGDMFQRADNYSTLYNRVAIGSTVSIATTNGSQLQLGTKIVQSGSSVTLLDGEASPTTAFTVPISATATSFKIDYSITRGGDFRTGTFWVASTGGEIFNYMDDYTQNIPNGGNSIILSANQSGTTVYIQYTSTPSTSVNAQMTYSISYLK
jgi:hypothetical protein